MLKVEQQKLAQEVNSALVDIRAIELDYFVQFFNAFATQCAMIMTAELVALAEIRTEDSDNNVVYSYVFWVFLPLTIGLCMHVILCSVYIVVYGQGLALRGPIGSMVKAIEGMVVEQKQIVNSFTLCIICLALGTMAAFFIQMNFYNAIVACVLLFFCMVAWYHYCLRIYNRFKLPDTELNNIGTKAWMDGRDSNVSTELPRAMQGGGASPLHVDINDSMRVRESFALTQKLMPNRPVDDDKSEVTRASFMMRPSESIMAGIGSIRASITGRGSIVGSSRRNGSDSDSDEGSSARTKQTGNNYSSQTAETMVKNTANTFYQGYISLLVNRSKKGRVGGFFTRNGKWERVYLLVCYSVSREVLLAYYSNKSDFETAPGRPVKNRPFDVTQYTFAPVKGSVSDGSLYGMMLTPGGDCDADLLPLEFRCDTYEEFTNWSNIFNRILKPTPKEN